MLVQCNISSLLTCRVLVVSSDWDPVLREARKQLAPTKQTHKFTVDVQSRGTAPRAAGVPEKKLSLFKHQLPSQL